MEARDLQIIANILRRDVLQMTTEAGSGHPTSCLSCAEIMSVLFFNEMQYDVTNAFNPDNDEFILSKGHAAPILYSVLYHAKCIKEDLMGLRKIDSPLEGHPIPDSVKWVKVATGSLGQGLSAGVGMALAGKLQKRNFRVYALIGDSESSEGEIYEALQLASYYELDNLCIVVDVNKLGQRGETMLGYSLEDYEKRFKAFGWGAIVINGHDVNHLLRAFQDAKRIRDKPTVILAKTVKGKGVSFLENKNGWHGKALNKEELKKALEEIPNVKIPSIKIIKPEKINIKKEKIEEIKFNDYKIGEEIATREAYGKAIAKLTEVNSDVIAVDAEVSNSTYADEVKKVKPKQFIEAFIAEQNMIGMILGLSKKGFDVFGSTFAAFLTRAFDQIRMASLSSANFTLSGSHAGISIGEDGVSQMGLEDIAMFRSLPNTTIFYPADAISMEKIVAKCLEIKGIKYIRTTRAKTPVLYDKNEKFNVGDFKVLKKSEKDKVVIAGTGITLHEGLKAYEILKHKDFNAAVIDLYCIKPFNAEKFISFVQSHGGKIIVVEDHYIEGGIGEMLASELKNTDIKIKHLAIRKIPHSGKKEELLKKYKIDSEAIIKKCLNN